MKTAEKAPARTKCCRNLDTILGGQVVNFYRSFREIVRTVKRAKSHGHELDPASRNCLAKPLNPFAGNFLSGCAGTKKDVAHCNKTDCSHRTVMMARHGELLRKSMPLLYR